MVWPRKRDIGTSYCRILLHDTMLNKDSHRTGTSDTPIYDYGMEEETVTHLLFCCGQYNDVMTLSTKSCLHMMLNSHSAINYRYFLLHHVMTTLPKVIIIFWRKRCLKCLVGERVCLKIEIHKIHSNAALAKYRNPRNPLTVRNPPA